VSFALQAPAALSMNCSSLAVKAMISLPQFDGPQPTNTPAVGLAYEQDYTVQKFNCSVRTK